MCGKELELDSGDSPEPRNSGGRALSRGPTWPDLDTPQEGSVEAD